MHILHIVNGDVTVTMVKVIIIASVTIKGTECFVNYTLLVMKFLCYHVIIFKKFL